MRVHLGPCAHEAVTLVSDAWCLSIQVLDVDIEAIIVSGCHMHAGF